MRYCLFYLTFCLNWRSMLELKRIIICLTIINIYFMNARLSKENLDWAYANLKEENLSYLIQVAEAELKQILAQENYLEEAVSFFYNYRQGFVFAHALGNIARHCDDPTYQKAENVMFRVFKEDDSIFLAVIIAAAYPYVSEGRKHYLKQLELRIDFGRVFNPDKYIFAYNDLYLANRIVSSSAFLEDMLQKCEAGIKESIGCGDWGTSDAVWAKDGVANTILFLNKMGDNYSNGLSKICQIAVNHYTDILIKSVYARVLWKLSKYPLGNEQRIKELADEAFQIMVDIAAKKPIAKVAEAILYRNKDVEWQIKCFGACAKAFPQEVGRYLMPFEEDVLRQYDIGIDDIAEYLPEMYAQVLSPATEKEVIKAIVGHLKFACFFENLSTANSLVLLAAKSLSERYYYDYTAPILANVLKLDWSSDEMPALEEFVQKVGSKIGGDELKKYTKHLGFPPSGSKMKLFRILVEEATGGSEVSLEDFKGIQYYLSLLYDFEKDLPNKNLEQAWKAYQKELEEGGKFKECLNKLMALVGGE